MRVIDRYYPTLKWGEFGQYERVTISKSMVKRGLPRKSYKYQLDYQGFSSDAFDFHPLIEALIIEPETSVIKMAEGGPKGANSAHIERALQEGCVRVPLHNEIETRPVPRGIPMWRYQETIKKVHRPGDVAWRDFTTVGIVLEFKKHEIYRTSLVIWFTYLTRSEALHMSCHLRALGARLEKEALAKNSSELVTTQVTDEGERVFEADWWQDADQVEIGYTLYMKKEIREALRKKDFLGEE